jgi:hypothetical protein
VGVDSVNGVLTNGQRIVDLANLAEKVTHFSDF